MLTRLYHNSTHPSAREAAQPALKLAEEVREWKAALPACAQLGPGFSGPIVTLLQSVQCSCQMKQADLTVGQYAVRERRSTRLPPSGGRA